jgi:hypothetical protein
MYGIPYQPGTRDLPVIHNAGAYAAQPTPIGYATIGPYGPHTWLGMLHLHGRGNVTYDALISWGITHTPEATEHNFRNSQILLRDAATLISGQPAIYLRSGPSVLKDYPLGYLSRTSATWLIVALRMSTSQSTCYMHYWVWGVQLAAATHPTTTQPDQTAASET